MPEKSGMGVGACAHAAFAHAGIAVATITKKRKSCRHDVMISSRDGSPSPPRACRGKRSRERPHGIRQGFGVEAENTTMRLHNVTGCAGLPMSGVPRRPAPVVLPASDPAS
jgi:hypothetical protein